MDRPEDGLPLDPEFPEDAGPKIVPPPKYEDLQTEEPELELDLGDLPSSRSLTEAEDETEQKSDFQVALKELRPYCPDEKLRLLIESIRVSRIYPDNLLDKLYMLAMSRYEDDEGDEDIDFILVLSLLQDALLVGLEGKGIIDVMEMLGATKEAELAKLETGLGLN